jgi:transposase
VFGIFETERMDEADRVLLEEVTGVGKKVPVKRKRGELTEAAKAVLMPDALWEKVRVLLPEHPNTHRFGGGRPRADDRRCMDAIFFVLRTGCQWKALDATGICPGSTAHDRFQEWAGAGVFAKLWRLGLRYYDQLVGIDWEVLAEDGCMTKAPLGGEKDGEESHRSRQVGREAVGPDRRGGDTAGGSRLGRERARQVAGGRDAAEPAGGRPRADGRRAAAPVRRQGV